jgi:hypothetical protein
MQRRIRGANLQQQNKLIHKSSYVTLVCGQSLTQRMTLTELENDTSAAARMAAAAHDLQKENRRLVVK